MIRDNVVVDKSMEFAIRIVKLYKYLQSDKSETVMSKQLLRSGTSIGANAREGVYGQSRGDFVSKMSIALKEAVETEYLSEHEYESIIADCSEIAKLLTAIVRNTKK